MDLHCGLHAVNAVLRAVGRRPYTAARLDDLTGALHARERRLCPTARDVAPDPRGNYPLETLLLALRRRGLCAEFVRAPYDRGAPADRRAAGYLVGTGDHYTAVVRDDRRSGWEHWDNGRVRAAWPDDGTRSPLSRVTGTVRSAVRLTPAV
jgi:hypothetical protein